MSRFSHRVENNELCLMPGFYFCPPVATQLVKLRDDERFRIYCDGAQLLMAVFPNKNLQKGEYADMIVAMENANIPTHRDADVPMPEMGTVPRDLFNVRPRDPGEILWEIYTPEQESDDGFTPVRCVAKGIPGVTFEDAVVNYLKRLYINPVVHEVNGGVLFRFMTFCQSYDDARSYQEQ